MIQKWRQEQAGHVVRIVWIHEYVSLVSCIANGPSYLVRYGNDAHNAEHKHTGQQATQCADSADQTGCAAARLATKAAKTAETIAKEAEKAETRRATAQVSVYFHRVLCACRLARLVSSQVNAARAVCGGRLGVGRAEQRISRVILVHAAAVSG